MKGFTLIEIVIVTALFSILLSLGLLMSFGAFQSAFHRSEVDVIVSLLERARSRAMNNIDQSTWGVCYLGSEYLVLKNSAVCDADAAVERISANENVAEASGFNDTPSEFPVVVFAQLRGDTNDASFEVKQNERVSTVSLNHEGTISW